jgi:hypothetical protein
MPLESPGVKGMMPLYLIPLSGQAAQEQPQLHPSERRATEHMLSSEVSLLAVSS